MASIKDADLGAADDESGSPCKCLIIYDGKLDSELGPYGDVCKTTALRQASLKRLVSCVRLARPSGQIGKVLQKGDVLAVMDSFSQGGSISQILEAVSEEIIPADDDHEPEESVAKKRKPSRRKIFEFQRTLKIVYSEATLLARRARTSRAFMGVRQVEGMLCVSSTKITDLGARDNLHHSGCTDGKMLREK